MGRHPASGLCRLGSCVTWPLEALRSSSTPCALECLETESAIPSKTEEEAEQARPVPSTDDGTHALAAHTHSRNTRGHEEP
mmetsp:Transcript_13076/g.38703  ORF Transcript_13076/g.38703 Transcript_13076/m.38703 type:complete len:81 (-) Transcript_13076:1272-1514(-)